jgi:hypothetical protein
MFLLKAAISWVIITLNRFSIIVHHFPCIFHDFGQYFIAVYPLDIGHSHIAMENGPFTDDLPSNLINCLYLHIEKMLLSSSQPVKWPCRGYYFWGSIRPQMPPRLWLRNWAAKCWFKPSLDASGMGMGWVNLEIWATKCGNRRVLRGLIWFYMGFCMDNTEIMG